MEPKLTYEEACDLLERQPVGTDLVMLENSGLVFRKLDTGMWHQIDWIGTHPAGWKPDAFRLDQEKLAWALY